MDAGRARPILLALALAAGIAGCDGGVDPPGLRIACVGDSLTFTAMQSTWVSMLSELVAPYGWAARPSAMPGATVIDHGLVYPGVAPPVPFWAGWWADRVVARWHPDVLILAIGTNDVGAGDPPMAIFMAMVDEVIRLEAAGVGRVRVATVPPWFPPAPVEKNAAIDDLNALIRFGLASRMIDFHDGFDRDDFQADGVHLTLAGHRKRAAIAAAALERGCGRVRAKRADTYPRPCRDRWTGPCTSGATCAVCRRHPTSPRCIRRLRAGTCRCTPPDAVAGPTIDGTVP